jgi:hypothetical protein
LVCPNDTIKVPRAFVEDVSDAVSYPTKWLKSSVERLSEKGYVQCSDRGFGSNSEVNMG